MTPIRVAIADDQEFARMALRVLLEREADIALVGEAADGAAALHLVRRERPDVLLLDIRMPGVDGIDVLRTIAGDAALAHTRVVVVTTFELDEYIAEALGAGASGFLVKDDVPADLIRSIRTVVAGDALLSPSVTRRVLRLYGRHRHRATAPRPGWSTLTNRERNIVGWVATGRSNAEIAEELHLSPDTVRTHVSRAMVKLHARDRAQLVVLAIDAGLEVPPPST